MGLNEMALKIADDAARSTIELYCVGEAYDNGPMWYTAQSTDFQDQIDEAIKYLEGRGRIQWLREKFKPALIRVDVENFGTSNNTPIDWSFLADVSDDIKKAADDYFVRNPVHKWIAANQISPSDCVRAAFYNGALFRRKWNHEMLLKELRTSNAQNTICNNPIDMILFCPYCGKQHIDKPDPASGWNNPPHRTHLCAGCGSEWRPATIATNGVAKITEPGDLLRYSDYGLLEDRLAQHEFLMRSITTAQHCRSFDNNSIMAKLTIEFPMPQTMEEGLELIGEDRRYALGTRKDLINIGMRYAEKLAEKTK